MQTTFRALDFDSVTFSALFRAARKAGLSVEGSKLDIAGRLITKAGPTILNDIISSTSSTARVAMAAAKKRSRDVLEYEKQHESCPISESSVAVRDTSMFTNGDTKKDSKKHAKSCTASFEFCDDDGSWRKIKHPSHVSKLRSLIDKTTKEVHYSSKDQLYLAQRNNAADHQILQTNKESKVSRKIRICCAGNKTGEEAVVDQTVDEEAEQVVDEEAEKVVDNENEPANDDATELVDEASEPADEASELADKASELADKASEASDEETGVAGWLISINLGQYADALIDEGYDDIDSLKHKIDIEFVKKSCFDIQMKPGHIGKLLAELKEARCEAM